MPNYFHGEGIAAELKQALAAARKYVKENPGEVSIATALAGILNNWGISYHTKNDRRHIPDDHDHIEAS